MSDMMLLGVLRMPMDNPTPLQLAQFIARARQASDRIEADAKEIERLNVALAASRAENSRLRRRRNEIDDEAEEYAEQVEQLQRKLMLVTNFPSHPGGHPDDQSENAMVPADWRHGWICAVAAIQESVAGKEDV